MRTIIAVLFISLLVLVAPVQAAEEPVTLLASAKGVLLKDDSRTLTVNKLQRGQDVLLQVEQADGKVLWKSDSLGSEDKAFIWQDKAEKLVLADLDGDGRLEILTAAFYGPRASGLYVFRADEGLSFVPMKCRFPEDDVERDCIVSDMHQENGWDLVFLRPDTVQALGMQFSEDPEGEARPSHYLFKLKGDAFILERVKPLPPPK